MVLLEAEAVSQIAFSFFQQVGSLTDEERNMFMTQQYLTTGTILLW